MLRILSTLLRIGKLIPSRRKWASYLEGEYRNKKKSVTERVTDYDYISKNDKTIVVDPRLDFAVGRMEIPYKDWGLPANDWVRNGSSGGVFLPKKHVYSKAEQDAGLAGSTYSSGWLPILPPEFTISMPT